jgi:hypothetical protein
MVNYNNGKIYKIVCNITGEIYIGSTCEPTLARRLAKHRDCYNCWKRGKKSSNVKSFQIIERGDYSIVLIENINCETKEQLLRRERFHIESNTCINKFIPLRTKAEWYLDNKENIAEQKKQYREEHKEETKEYHKEYYLKNKEQQKQYQKEYRLKKKNNPNS